MKPVQAILLAIGLAIIGSLINFNVAGTKVSLLWIIVLITAIWAAVDSSKLQLRRYRSGIAYGPAVLFVLFLLLWIVAFPWYLCVRHKIRNGSAVLKEPVPTNA